MKNIAIDKQMHFLCCSVVMFVFYHITKDVVWSMSIALVLGAAKEVIWDKLLKRGTPETMDMLFNLFGVLFAAAVIVLSDLVRGWLV